MKEGWKILKIKDICDKGSSNLQQNKLDGLDGEYPVFGASGFIKNINIYHQEKPYIGIVKDGSGVGRTNFYPAYSSLLGTLQYIIPKEGYDIAYVAYALKSIDFSSFVAGAAIPHIYFKDYGNCQIPVPPLSEQQQIVEELDLLSGIIEKKKEQLKELDNLAQSIFYEMFGDPVANEKGWEFCELSHLFNIKGGKRIPKGMSYSLTKTNHPYLRATDMKNNTIMDDDIHYIDSDVFEKIKNYTVSAGDIYLTNVGVNLGMAGVIPNKYDGANLTENAVKLVAKSGKEVVGLYISFYLNTNEIQACINERKMTVGVPKLAIFRIESISLLLPPLSLQQSFASKIEAIEKQKALIKQSITETETLFNSRMDYYFG